MAKPATLERQTGNVMEEDSTKKIPPAGDRKEVFLVNEALILYVLEQSDERLTQFEISKAVSQVKHEGKKEIQVSRTIKNLEAIGAIVSGRFRVDEGSEYRVIRYKITVKGQNILKLVTRLMELIFQED